MEKQRPPVAKKKYSPPLLTVHGTVRELTQKVGLHGKKDKVGGGGFRIRTQT